MRGEQMNTILTVKDKNYVLKLTMRGCINLEKTLGTNPANVLMAMASGEAKMPNMTGMMAIIHEALQPMNHGISLDDTYELFDDWFAEGHDMNEYIQLVVDILQSSGLLPKEDEIKETKKAKNA